MSNFELKLRIPLAWYSPDPMHATKSRFEVPNRRFKGIWNLIFSKQGSIWGQNFNLGSCMELVSRDTCKTIFIILFKLFSIGDSFEFKPT